jgi:hypothetical protein
MFESEGKIVCTSGMSGMSGYGIARRGGKIGRMRIPVCFSPNASEGPNYVWNKIHRQPGAEGLIQVNPA